jgi:serine/threonine protein kinase
LFFQLQAEIKIHRTLKHKFVCEYKHFFEDRQNCYILLELCHNQSMNEMIKRRKRLTEPEAAYFMRQLLQAVRYLHDNLVIHRDLKLGNLFLDRNVSVKVGDLGLATKLESVDEKRKTICGTPNYIAPEVIQGDRSTRGHSFEVDVWSMGVILYTFLVGKPPYEAKDVKATYQRILANEYSFPKDANISDDAKDLIRSMLQSKPIDRPSLEEIAVHPFFTDHPIPASLPSNATHAAPKWEQNEYGDLVVAQKDASRKPALPRSSSQRRPLGARDTNVVERGSEQSERSKPSKVSRDVMEGVVKNALSGLSNMVGSTKTLPTQPAFQVFDETEDVRRTASSSYRKPLQTQPVDEDLISRAAAMTIRVQAASPFHHSSVPSPREALPSPAVSAGLTPETDAFVLHNMIARIETVLEVTSKRSYSHVHPDSPSLVAFSRGGPTKWVSRYVDYTSKYGLGFLLSDGR